MTVHSFLASAAFALAVAATPAHAVGTLVIGACGAYGTSYDFDYPGEARRAAFAHCDGRDCRVALTIRNQCAAFAIQRRDACGARGWAYASSRSEAEGLAMQYCYDNGGRRCRVRASVCDERG